MHALTPHYNLIMCLLTVRDSASRLPEAGGTRADVSKHIIRL